MRGLVLFPVMLSQMRPAFFGLHRTVAVSCVRHSIASPRLALLSSARCVASTAAESADTKPEMEKVRKQVEYYFSDKNLQTDVFLHQRLSTQQGRFPVQELLKFNAIRALRASTAEIITALQGSQQIKIVQDGPKPEICRPLPLPPLSDSALAAYNARKVVAVDVPCKYFAAAGFCSNLDRYGTCREGVGNRANGKYVTKSHDLDAARRLVAAWLAARRPPPAAGAAAPQRYKAAAVLDMEGGASREVIELPCVVVDLATCQERGRFHRWVRPEGLIGARRAAGGAPPVATDAVPFKQALAELSAFLKEHDAVLGETAVPVFCGDHEARLLRRATQACRIPMPAGMDAWVNIKDLAFQHAVGKQMPESLEKLAEMMDGMNRLARHLKLEPAPPEQQHLGMFDSEGISKILVRLLQDGVVLAPTARFAPRPAPRPADADAAADAAAAAILEEGEGGGDKGDGIVHLVEHWIRRYHVFAPEPPGGPPVPTRRKRDSRRAPPAGV